MINLIEKGRVPFLLNSIGNECEIVYNPYHNIQWRILNNKENLITSKSSNVGVTYHYNNLNVYIEFNQKKL